MKKLFRVIAGSALMAVFSIVASAETPLRTQWRISTNTYAYQDVIYALGFYAPSFVSQVTTAGTLVVTGGSTLPVHDVALEELPAMTTGQILVGDSSDSNANVVVASGVTFDASGAATVAASALSGDIAADRMTANGVVATDFTQDGGILVGTGSGAFVEETGATLRASIDCPANSQVFGASSVTIGDIASGQLVTTNSIAMLDTAGNAKAGYALIRVWVSESAPYGPASTNNIEALTLSDGSAVATETANADYWYVTSSNGTATATITATATGTNYLNVAVGANVTSEPIVLIP